MGRRPALGQRVQAERHTRGWTQDELATRAGLSAGGIALIEQGRRPNASAPTLEKLAAAFGVSIDYLLSGRDVEDYARPPLDLARAGGLTEYACARLAQAWPGYSIERRALWWRRMEALAAQEDAARAAAEQVQAERDATYMLLDEH